MSDMTMRSLKEGLVYDLEDEKIDILNDRYPEDRIWEYVDSACPIYTYDILAVAQSDLDLAVLEPECYAFGGDKTAVNAISGNIFEVLMEEGHRWLYHAQEDTEKCDYCSEYVEEEDMIPLGDDGELLCPKCYKERMAEEDV